MRSLLKFSLPVLALSLALPLFARESQPATPNAAPRVERNFDFNWKFSLGDFPDAFRQDFDDSSWRTLDVPHDWSIEGAYNKNNPGGGIIAYLPTGIGWYRKSFQVTPEMLKRDISVTFDGIFMDSTVWINGVKLGTHPYGYLSFAEDLTGHLHAGKNVIAVRVDNSKQPAARWYTGSGIYAHVHLLETEPEHIAQWSTFVRTAKLETDRAIEDISTAVDLPQGTNRSGLLLRFAILDSQNRAVAHQFIALKKSNVPDLKHPIELAIRHPALWTPDTPALYTLRIELIDGKSIRDIQDTAFGIRTVAFDPQRGFLLNGNALKIRGVADHLYGGPMGTAVPDGILKRRLKLLKDMGVNAIRTAHNPRTPAFYDLCDRTGILVMDELYDGWDEKVENDYGARFYQDHWRGDVETWVRRDRNHPSVFLWSIGNETGLTDVKHMTEWVHQFDPTRPTTGGMLINGVDVSGWNAPGETAGVLEKFHAEHPSVPIILTEEPHTLQTRGYYRVRTWWRDWQHFHEFQPYGTEQIFFDGKQWYNSSYDNAIARETARTSWKRTASTPWISGEFRWTGFDYLGEATYKGGRWPARAGNFGVIDLALIPKDHYYLYQAFWTTKPMVHLLPHWTHPGMDGIVIPVVVYSNQPQVELFLNGKSLGCHTPGPLGDFVWNVPYTPGELKAVAYASNGKQVASTEFKTAGDPTNIQLQTDNDDLLPDRTDDAVVTFTVTDKNGVMVPWDMNRVHFKVAGPVHVLGYDNGDPTDVTPNQAPYRNAFYGTGRGFYQSTADDGPVEVTAAAILGNPYMGAVRPNRPRQVAIAVSRVALRGKLPQVNMQIHYTLDGSAPTPDSPVYSGPFIIRHETNVRALVTRDGKPYMTLSTWFHKIDEPLVSDPRWATDSRWDPNSRQRKRP